MTDSAFTPRLSPASVAALESLSRAEGRPMNELLNEAVRGYLRRSGEEYRSLKEDIESLRAYRLRDPDYRLAMMDFVSSELEEDDPLEGVPVVGSFIDGQFVENGLAQKKIRELLNA